ncbi:DUF4349 domain-containing protein [Kribbella flavida]|nr:DUF4349 domain-containing protein [Kribbella flavida]
MVRTRGRAAVAGMFLVAAMVLSGCGAGGDKATSSEGAAAPQADNAQPQDAGAGKSGAGTDSKSGAGGAAQPTVTRAIIKTGRLTIETADVNKQRQAAITIVAGLRGQVSSEDTGSENDGRITRANLVLKVPTPAYETAIERLSALGTRTSIHQESSDVTEQVVDVDSRIASQRASLERMRTLLAKASSIAEIVSVETELTRREADLESLLAKQKALSLQTELATLTLVITEPGKAPVVEKEDKGFLAGLKGGWNAFTATFFALSTAVGALLPFLIVAALIGIPLWRYRHRLRRTPVAAPAVAGASGPTPPTGSHQP